MHADANIERLLQHAYQPEEPDPAFVAQVGKLLQATAAERAPAPPHVLRLRRRLAWGMAAAAAVAVVVLGAYAMRPPPTERHDSNRMAVSAHQGETIPRNSEQPAAPHGLTARPRTPSPAAQPVAVGEEIRTRDGERRRVTLPDGSVLYVNQNTTAKVEAARRVVLSAGEVFVEVAPRTEDRFVLHAAGRDVAALGTKFAVRADNDGPRVFVTQGKVQVEGARALVHAGEQLVLATGHVTTAPRATHLLDWTRELMVAAESPLVPASKHQGGALLAVDPNGQEAKLSLRAYHVDVHLEDGFARTTIDQTYFNHETWRLEGTFYFPLPADASLSHLAMYVDGVLMQGGMCEREHARQVFETILHTQRDPALLEWVDGSTFKMRVFPLEGRQEKRILLSYTQRLDALYGQTKYRFPTGHNLEAVGEWSFQARIKRGGDLAWKCDSHALQATQKDGDLILTARQKHVKLDRDVTLRLHDAPAVGDLRFSTADHDGNRYLMVRYRPQLTAPVAKQRRDWVFLFESSGSRDPLLARVQIDVIRTILSNAEHDDTFAVVTAGTRAQSFASGGVPATPENVRQAVQWLERTHLVGAFDMAKGLAACEPFLKVGKNPYLVHVGSGISTIGERREEVLAKSIPEQVRYVGVGVGKRWSRGFMKLAAERTGGFFTQINPDEPVAWRAFDLLATLNTPRLLDVKVLDDAEKVSFHSYTTLLSDGEELCAIARVGTTNDPLPKSVAITGRLDGKPFTKTAAVRNVAAKADYLPRTWAKLEIDKLLAADAQANKAKLIELSKAMYVMTPFTSLLVLENDAMYTQFKVDRGRKDHWALYQSPEKIPIVHEPLPGTSTVSAAPPGQKPTPEQVLQTILVRIPPRFLQYPNRPDPYGGQLVATALQLYQGAFALVDPNYGLNLWFGHPVPVEEAEIRWETTRRLLTTQSFSLEDSRAAAVTYTRTPFGFINDFNGVTAPASLSPLGGGTFGGGGFGGGLAGFGGFQGFGGGGSFGGGFGSSSSGFGAPSNPFGQPQAQTRGLFGQSQARTRGDFGWANTFSPGGGFRRGSSTSPAGREVGMHIISGHNPTLVEDLIKAIEDQKESHPPGKININSLWSEAELDRLTPKGEMFLAGLNDANNPLEDSKRRRRRGYLFEELLYGQSQPNLLYERPAFSHDGRVFTDLVSYAPGMNTTAADIQAVLEAEARLPKTRTGKIDSAAQALLERNRGAGWQSIRLDGFVLSFDGTGRYAYERKLAIGLRERVVCDGTTLLHLYPELGIGARRAVSRFHRAWLNSVIPWMLPPVEDLARHADVTLVSERIVALTPFGAAAAKEKYGETHLVFAADGRLIERRIVEMPTKKVLARATYAPDSQVRLLDGADKVLAEHKLVVHPAETPNLRPDVSKLVVLALPLRTMEHVATQFPKEAVAGNFEKLSDDAALAVFASRYGMGQGTTLLNLFGNRYHRQGDRRLGFYALASATGATFAPGGEYGTGVYKVRFDPGAEHPRDPLATYLARYHQMGSSGRRELGTLTGPADGFLQRLAVVHDLWFSWHQGNAPRTDADRNAEWQRAVAFVKACDVSLFKWIVLDLMQRQYGAARSRELADLYRAADGFTGLAYYPRYEAARTLANGGHHAEARKQFEELYLAALKAGMLPAIDQSFYQSFHNSNGRESWLALVRKASDQLRGEKRPGEMIALAWQCHQVGDPGAASELIGKVLHGLAEELRPAVTLAVIDYCMFAGQLPRAEGLLQGLLEDKRFADHPRLLRLAAQLAFQQGMTARGIRALEKALDLEFRDLPAIVNLQVIRQEYSQLLAHYQQLALAVNMLEAEPPKEFLARVLRAADRWRALDPDPTAACQAAARVLHNLGVKELAWDYLTTPVGLKPNEASPWVSLARHLHGDGQFDLASRAYTTAFEAEPTNAQILWDHAQMLQQVGRFGEVGPLYQKLAESDWQPRFQGLKQQARQLLNWR